MDLSTLTNDVQRSIVVLMVDIIFAFQDKVQLAAANLLGLEIADERENLPQLLVSALISYLLSYRDEELPD